MVTIMEKHDQCDQEMLNQLKLFDISFVYEFLIYKEWKGELNTTFFVSNVLLTFLHWNYFSVINLDSESVESAKQGYCCGPQGSSVCGRIQHNVNLISWNENSYSVSLSQNYSKLYNEFEMQVTSSDIHNSAARSWS